MKSLQGGGFLVSPDHKFSGPMVTFLYPDCRLKFISAPGHFDFDFILQAMMQIFFFIFKDGALRRIQQQGRNGFSQASRGEAENEIKTRLHIEKVFAVNLLS